AKTDSSGLCIAKPGNWDIKWWLPEAYKSMGCVLFDESGRAREVGNSVYGTGFAGVRGHARSHKGPRRVQMASSLA
ncbi:MAG: hypothetical protein WBG97_25930, partial [Pseudomonas sp.]